ncbi:hypothetical protein CDL12_10963 [Handroanthus impetiginosus]|uniref:Uncharacterized protein n=1 Tax=Handroanthus impetiginosus TaxID=429701 RepID=A0A2G9HGH1_9LAMI|nr:hypothetical protein CDL12_10963 [Handroanthus impetiginosus]
MLKASTPITMTSPLSTGAAATPPPPPPPQTQKESFIRRYRFFWPFLLAVNFTIGVYVLTRTTKKDTGTSDVKKPEAPTSSTPTSTEKAHR